MTESFAQLFEESLQAIETRPGAIVRGTVVAIDKDVVLVDAGLKSESAIPVEQFKNAQGELEIQVGDEVDVALDAVEDGFGETVLSREKAKRHEAWLMLEKAYEEAETVTGVINGKVKGGFTVELNGIRAFLPGSLVDVRPVRDTTHLEGKELEFKVIKLDQKRNNVVVSRRAVIESENSAERDQLLENLQEGMEVKGIVKNLTDYGAFVDLGGVDGLLHITDMAWKRVKHPSEIVNVGDEITVKVLKFDRERTRVSLGLKQLGEDPWVAIAKRYPENTRLTGRVTNLTDYGCFVEIEEGVEGLVHVSEMDWTNKNIHPSKVVNVGDVVEVMVLDIDEERRRISLGLKQCKSNPWQQFAETHNKGDRVEGKIKSITDFGIFVGLDGGIDMDMNAIPDAAMTIATTALFAEGTTTIRNIYNWRVKETDRLSAMAAELRKVGAQVEEGHDYIQVTPPAKLQHAEIETYNDHRIAMCFSLVALSDTPVTILDPGCTAKTFPGYFSELAALSE